MSFQFKSLERCWSLLFNKGSLDRYTSILGHLNWWSNSAFFLWTERSWFVGQFYLVWTHWRIDVSFRSILRWLVSFIVNKNLLSSSPLDFWLFCCSWVISWFLWMFTFKDVWDHHRSYSTFVIHFALCVLLLNELV